MLLAANERFNVSLRCSHDYCDGLGWFEHDKPCAPVYAMYFPRKKNVLVLRRKTNRKEEMRAPVFAITVAYPQT